MLPDHKDDRVPGATLFASSALAFRSPGCTIRVIPLDRPIPNPVMAKPSKSLKVRVGNVLEGGPLPPAEGANYFQFAFVAGEVQMLVSAIDLNRVHLAAIGAKGVARMRRRAK